jgi:pimeloyl-ACP methyl ester carboxylesterase
MTRRIVLLFATLALVLAGGVVATRFARARAAAAHWSFGRGPTVVLVHGLGSGIEHWLPVARRLARTHRVTFVELPGHGLTPLPEPLTVDGAARSLVRALEDLSHEPVLLVGHSLGGLVAARVALDRPDRVTGLVLVDASLAPLADPEDASALRAALDRDPRGVLRDAFLGFGRDSAQGEKLWAGAAANDPAMLRAWVELALVADLSGRVSGLRVPALAVVSERTWPAGEPWGPTARALGVALVPRLQVARFEDCGHFLMLDRPEALAERIARFGRSARGEPVAAR